MRKYYDLPCTKIEENNSVSKIFRAFLEAMQMCLNVLAKISQRIAKRSGKANRSLPSNDFVCTGIEIVKLN